MSKFNTGDKVKVVAVHKFLNGLVEVGETGYILQPYLFDTDIVPTFWTYIVLGDKGWKYGLSDNELELV